MLCSTQSRERDATYAFCTSTAKLSPHLDRLNTLSENRVEMKSKAHNNFSHTYSRYLGDSWLNSMSQRWKIEKKIIHEIESKWNRRLTIIFLILIHDIWETPGWIRRVKGEKSMKIFYLALCQLPQIATKILRTHCGSLRCVSEQIEKSSISFIAEIITRLSAPPR